MRSKRLHRCQTCGLSMNLCMCATLPLIAGRTRVVILAHRAELLKPTNTGKLCAHMLGARAALLRSDAPPPEALLTDPSPPVSVAVPPGPPVRDPLAAAESGAFLLFPSDDAVALDEVRDRVRTLIVPDGTWAQARRMARRHPICSSVAKVRLPSVPESRYQLRRNREHGGLCTLEAVAHALGILEGEDTGRTLLGAFEAWVERALLVRAGAHDARANLTSLLG